MSFGGYFLAIIWDEVRIWLIRLCLFVCVCVCMCVCVCVCVCVYVVCFYSI